MKKIIRTIAALFLSSSVLFFSQEIYAAAVESQVQKPALGNVIILVGYVIITAALVIGCIALVKWLKKTFK